MMDVPTPIPFTSVSPTGLPADNSDHKTSKLRSRQAPTAQFVGPQSSKQLPSAAAETKNPLELMPDSLTVECATPTPDEQVSSLKDVSQIHPSSSDSQHIASPPPISFSRTANDDVPNVALFRYDELPGSSVCEEDPTLFPQQFPSCSEVETEDQELCVK